MTVTLTAHRKMGLTIAAAIILGLGSAHATDYSAWNYSSKISFTGYTRAEPLTGFPMLVVVGTNIPNFNYNQMQSPAGGDLRFAGPNGTDDLNFEIEQWNTNGNSYVWVQVPVLTSPDDFIYAHWGRDGQTAPPCSTNGATWSNAYVAVWHMNQTNAQDSTVSRNNGTSAANVNAGGVIGIGQSFNGNAAIQSPTSASFDSVTNAVTLSAWVYLRSSGTYPMVFTRGRDQLEVRLNGTNRQL